MWMNQIKLSLNLAMMQIYYASYSLDRYQNIWPQLVVDTEVTLKRNWRDVKGKNSRVGKKFDQFWSRLLFLNLH